MKKTFLVNLLLSQVAFGQRGAPLDGVDYKSDPWSTGNLILWAIIIIALGYSFVKSLGKAEAEKELREKQKRDKSL